MTAKPIFNDHTRIWFFDRRGEGTKRYGLRVGAADLDIKRHSIVLHLIEPIVKAPGKHTDLLSFFEVGMDIHITHCEVGRPDRYENNTPILILKNVSFVNSWVDDPVALDAHHVHQIMANLRVESWDYEWGTNEE